MKLVVLSFILLVFAVISITSQIVGSDDYSISTDDALVSQTHKSDGKGGHDGEKNRDKDGKGGDKKDKDKGKDKGKSDDENDTSNKERPAVSHPTTTPYFLRGDNEQVENADGNGKGKGDRGKEEEKEQENEEKKEKYDRNEEKEEGRSGRIGEGGGEGEEEQQGAEEGEDKQGDESFQIVITFVVFTLLGLSMCLCMNYYRKLCVYFLVEPDTVATNPVIPCDTGNNHVQTSAHYVKQPTSPSASVVPGYEEPIATAFVIKDV